jgi:hypothetical protein
MADSPMSALGLGVGGEYLDGDGSTKTRGGEGADEVITEFMTQKGQWDEVGRLDPAIPE